MGIKSKPIIMEAVTPPLPVNKKTGISAQLRARSVVDSLLPQYSQHFHKVILSPEDKRFVVGWYQYGRQSRKGSLRRGTLYAPLEGMSPLGQVCVLALALGLLGLQLPEGIQSIHPPPPNAA